MFEDSLFDSGGGRRHRKTGAKLISFVIELCVVGVLVLLPMIFTQALPKQIWTSVLESPPPPRGAPPRELRSHPRVERTSTNAQDNVIREPAYIPRVTQMVRDEPVTDEGRPSVGNLVICGAPDGKENAVLTEIARAVPPTTTKLTPPAQKLRVSSGVAAGMLVQQVKPHYPPLVVQARIQGTVVLQAVIGKDGKVHELLLVSGHPLLAPAAMEAVKQWRYRPYLLNGEPVDVDTQINVNFMLGGG